MRKNYCESLKELGLMESDDENVIIYKNVYSKLSNKEYSSLLIWIYKDDSSIMFEDIVSDTYLKVINGEINLEDINETYIKQYRIPCRSNRHSELYEDLVIINNFEDNILDEIPKNHREIFDSIDFKDDDLKTILYLMDKRNIKKYNYDYIKRKDGRGIEYQKLCKEYEEIINKLLIKLKGECLNGNNL